MTAQWKIAALGALGGAVIAVAIVFVSAGTGFLPQRVDGRQVRAYLLSHPDIIVELTNRLSDQQAADAERAQQEAVRRMGLKTFFDPKVAFVTGPTNAKSTFVEFYDYDCPYCRASLPAVKKFYETHRNDTRFSFIEFPIPEQHGPGAVLAARASIAARRQPAQFVAFHFAMMGEDGAITEQMIYDDAAKCGMDVTKLKADMADASVDRAIQEAHALARRAKVDGTPTFLFNGRLRAGAVDDETLAAIMKGKAV